MYNFEQDRTETNDLAAKAPERVKRMVSDYSSWAEKIGVREWSSLEQR